MKTKKTKDMFCNYHVSQDNCIMDENNNAIKTFKSNNYLQCCIFDIYGNKHTMGVHSVIAMLCIDEWYDGCIVHHIDGDTLNNSVSNLEIMSRAEHAKHHIKDGTIQLKVVKRFGEANPQHKLTKSQVEYIRNVFVKGDREYGINALARKFNVSRPTISDIVNYKTWKI